MADEWRIPGTYLFREMQFFVVIDPDGMSWAFSENGEEESASDVVRGGERLSADIPDWVLRKAKEAREDWDAFREKMKRLERDKQTTKT